LVKSIWVGTCKDWLFTFVLLDALLEKLDVFPGLLAFLLLLFSASLFISVSGGSVVITASVVAITSSIVTTGIILKASD
jgi:hypothetical protein